MVADGGCGAVAVGGRWWWLVMMSGWLVMVSGWFGGWGVVGSGGGVGSGDDQRPLFY